MTTRMGFGYFVVGLSPDDIQALQIVLEAAECRGDLWQAFADAGESWAIDATELLEEMYEADGQERKDIAERTQQAITHVRGILGSLK